jgi:hypothetical protein
MSSLNQRRAGGAHQKNPERSPRTIGAGLRATTALSGVLPGHWAQGSFLTRHLRTDRRSATIRGPLRPAAWLHRPLAGRNESL